MINTIKFHREGGINALRRGVQSYIIERSFEFKKYLKSKNKFISLTNNRNAAFSHFRQGKAIKNFDFAGRLAF
jgi:hypothetical protein